MTLPMASASPNYVVNHCEQLSLVGLVKGDATMRPRILKVVRIGSSLPIKDGVVGEVCRGLRMSGSAGDFHMGVLRGTSDNTRILWAKLGRVMKLTSQCFGGPFTFGSRRVPGIGGGSAGEVPKGIFSVEVEIGGTIILGV